MPKDGREGGIRVLPVAATRLLAICGKCGKKLGGGFGERRDRSLVKALKRGVPELHGKRARVRVVETKCLDICPKGAVALVDSAAPGEVLIVARGTAVEAVAARLALIPRHPGERQDPPKAEVIPAG